MAVVSAAAVPLQLDVSWIASYVESCRVADGGYFFAQIPPAGAQDTYFALASLRFLGKEAQDAPGVKRWVEEWRREPANVSSIRSVYLLCGLLDELGEGLDPARPYARAIAGEANALGGFGAYEDVYVESASELQATFEAVSALARLGHPLNHGRIEGFVSRFRQPDGGFGGHRSTLVSTYYACATLAQLGKPALFAEGANLYLRRRAQRWDIYFLDDVFWLIQGLSLTGGAAAFALDAATHVLACQRAQGGFARAPAIGIPTLEYTYYALQVLDSVGLLVPGGER
jgi:hypothetical protein